MTSADWTHGPSRELIKEKYMSANWLSSSTVRYFWFSAAQTGCQGNSYRAVTKLSNETFQQKVISALVSHRAMGKRRLLAQNLFIDSRNQTSEPTMLYNWVKKKSWYWSSMTTSFCFPFWKLYWASLFSKWQYRAEEGSQNSQESPREHCSRDWGRRGEASSQTRVYNQGA